MTVDPSAQAFTAQGIYRRGVACTFQRLSGFPPNPVVVAYSAAVVASIHTAIADTQETARTGYSASSEGSVSQDDRLVIVMAADLAAQGFPFPPAKDDRIVVTATGDKFNVTKVDLYKRDLAGAIELTVTGIA